MRTVSNVLATSRHAFLHLVRPSMRERSGGVTVSRYVRSDVARRDSVVGLGPPARFSCGGVDDDEDRDQIIGIVRRGVPDQLQESSSPAVSMQASARWRG